MWNQEKFQKAIAFAGFAHRHQKVPGKDYNYVVHISNVAAEIARAICTEKIGDADIAIQCALLHDVIEDTETLPETIREEFGQRVLDGVLALTKNESLEKMQAMTDSLVRIKAFGQEAACVKMADRITNLQAPPAHWSAEKIRQYAVEAEMIYSELKEYSAFLRTRLREKIDAYAVFFDV